MNSSDFLNSIKKKLAKGNPDIIYDSSKKIEYVQTGCMPFDMFIGGFPRRRLTEIFGPEGSGKSSLGLSASAQIQKNKGFVVYLDFENGFNHEFAKNAFGLNADNNSFILFQPKNAEEGGEIIDQISSLEKIDLLVIDSISAMQGKDSIEASLEDNQRVGHHARTVGRIIVKLKNLASEKNCAILLVNQLRTAIKMSMFDQSQGLGNLSGADSQFSTTGGTAPRFYSSLRIMLKNHAVKDKNDSKVILGNETEFKIKKSRVGTPHINFRATFNITINGQKPGWDNDKDLIKLAGEFGFIEQSGFKFKYNGSTSDLDLEVKGKDNGEKALLADAIRKEDAKKQVLNYFNRKKESGEIKMADIEDESSEETSIESSEDEEFSV